MGNKLSTITCSNCNKKCKKFQRYGYNCFVCGRPHCTDCSNREKILVDIEQKPKKKRVCHTCAISMDNILVESVRNSTEMSFAETGGKISKDLVTNPVLASTVVETNKLFCNIDVSQDNNFKLSLVEPFHNNSKSVIENDRKGKATVTTPNLDLFYEPQISKPLRSQRQITISFN